MKESVRILFLEDSEEDMLLAIHELLKNGIVFDYRRVETGEAFQQSLVQFHPHIILADYSLPGYDGRSALRHVRTVEPDTPFVFVTGTLGEELAIDLLREGATDYVLKNGLTRLAPAVQRALRENTEYQKRREIEEAHRIALERYRQVIENATDIVFTTDENGNFTYSNDAGIRTSGYSMGELWTLNYLELVIPGDRTRVRYHLMRQVLSKTPATSIEFPFRAKSGDVRWLSMNAAIVYDNGAYAGFHMIARDVTKRRQAEDALKKSLDALERSEEEYRKSSDQLRALAVRLQSAREDEQTRIAREIHDELGQALTGLKMDLVWVERKWKDGSAAVALEKLAAMHNLIDETVRMVRRISSELRPGALDDLGLVAALEWQLNEFAERTSIQGTFHSERELYELDRERSTAIFRIFQESLTNVARHSGATRFEVRLRTEQNTLVLEVQDNGRGISRAEIEQKNSLGLLGMRERAFVLNGSVDIAGTPGSGTKVIVRVPLAS